MKRLLILALLFMTYTPSVQAQFFRRRVQFVQQQQCYQQPTYYQPQAYYPTYQAVAAIPLATIPVAVDLQAYQYSVNAAAFQSFRDYQASRVNQEQAIQPTPVSGSVNVSSGEIAGLSGSAVLKQRCASCHTSGKIPRFFDGQGNLLAGAPLQDMLERITSDDPATRMPPKGQLPTREAMAVMNYAINGLGSAAPEKVAAVEPAKSRNPFE